MSEAVQELARGSEHFSSRPCVSHKLKMNRFRKKVESLLKEHGAVLMRQRKHKVYKLADGQTYVESSSPSDQNAARVQLRKLEHTLEVAKQAKPESNGRRVRRPTPGRAPAPIKYERVNTEGASFADKLRMVGAVEAKLRDELAMNQEHIDYLEAQIQERDERIGGLVELSRKLLDARCACCWCRFKSWCGLARLKGE